MRRGRREKQLEPTSPAAGFAAALREARLAAGSPQYRVMATEAHFSSPALSQAASGAKLPSWQVAAAYLKACGVTDLAPWENEWQIAKLKTKLARAKRATAANATYPVHRGNATTATSASVAVSTKETSASPHLQVLELLHQLRQSKGLSLRAVASQIQACQPDLAARGGPRQTYSCTTVHEVLTGQSPLTPDFVTIYLNAIGATETEQHHVGEIIGRTEYKTATTDLQTSTSYDQSGQPVADPNDVHSLPTAQHDPCSTVGPGGPCPRHHTSPDHPPQPPNTAAATPRRQGTVYASLWALDAVSHRAATDSRITAAVLDDPLADSFLLPAMDLSAPATPPPPRRPVPREHLVRRHRTRIGYHQPHTVTALTVIRRLLSPRVLLLAATLASSVHWASILGVHLLGNWPVPTLLDPVAGLTIYIGLALIVCGTLVLRAVRQTSRIGRQPAMATAHRRIGASGGSWPTRIRYQPRHLRAITPRHRPVWTSSQLAEVPRRLSRQINHLIACIANRATVTLGVVITTATAVAVIIASATGLPPRPPKAVFVAGPISQPYPADASAIEEPGAPSAMIEQGGHARSDGLNQRLAACAGHAGAHIATPCRHSLPADGWAAISLQRRSSE